MFKRIRTTDDATAFKAVYLMREDGRPEVEEREFKTIKALSQWVERNDCYAFMLINKYALIDDIWEPFTVIGKKTITLNELKNIVRLLEDETIASAKTSSND